MVAKLLKKAEGSKPRMKPADLKNEILTVLPELATEESLEDGLFRLNLMVNDDFLSAGYYIKDEIGVDICFLDGEIEQHHLENLADTVVESVGDCRGMGYFFVSNAFDEIAGDGYFDYSHYFVEDRLSVK